MKPACLALLLAIPAFGAPAAPTSDDAKLVDYFLKTPTGDLNPALIPRFMALEDAKVPAKQRGPVAAKRAELSALRRITEGKSKPPIRRAGQDPNQACETQESTKETVAWMKKFGFIELTEDEERFLEKRTKCTQCELSEEFSLTVYALRLPGKGKPRAQIAYLIKAGDPLEALITQYRSGHVSTDFFSSGFFGACR